MCIYIYIFLALQLINLLIQAIIIVELVASEKEVQFINQMMAPPRDLSAPPSPFIAQGGEDTKIIDTEVHDLFQDLIHMDNVVKTLVLPEVLRTKRKKKLKERKMRR